MARWASLLAAWAVAALPAGALAQARARVVLVPFENASRRGGAREAVMPAVEAALRAQGWDVVSGPPVEEFLKARRIRYLDSLGAVHVRGLVSAHRADALVVGSILAYEPGARNPRVTIVARIVSPEGAILSTDMGSASASGSEGAFGRGKLEKIEDVARRVVGDLASRWLAPLPQTPETFAGAPPVFRSRDLLRQHLEICVLPLQNFSETADAPRILDAVLQHRLSARPDMTPVQPADLRAAIVEARLQAPSVLSLDQLRLLSKVLGTPLFLRGTILAYGGRDPSGAAAPMELYLILIDARSGQVMWSGLHRRSGSDYERLLRRGAIQDDAELASRVVAELLDAFTRWRSTMEATE